MELSEILAVSGVPGLYKYVAQGKSGIIVESLTDGKRTLVSGSSKVSALGDIAIFTDTEEVPLAQVFESLQKAGKPVAITSKSTPDELDAFLKSALPTYDRERVHNSDIRKIALWYNTLVAAGMTSFLPKEEEEQAAPAEKEKKAAAKKPAAGKPAATPKASPKASGSKAAASRSTTARKAQ